VDLTEPDAPAQVVRSVRDSFGRLDALVNNAALARFGAIEQLAPEQTERVLRTNLLAPLELIRQAVPLLRESRGQVVNVGSIGGLLALPGRAGYGASKAALHHVTRSLARELAPEVRVNAVLPGAIDTDMYQDLGLSPDQVARLRAELVSTTPLGRMGTVEDVVPWIEQLLGPAGAWLTGSLIVVDGGRSC
jgi:NAD(P)-dependent dehydrogenase (short-subunit alcohol dehydrogenase family)